MRYDNLTNIIANFAFIIANQTLPILTFPVKISSTTSNPHPDESLRITQKFIHTLTLRFL